MILMRLKVLVATLLIAGAASAQGVNPTLNTSSGGTGSSVPPVVTVYPGQSVQAALTAVASSGGEVFVKSGSYPQSTSLFISSNTRLRCEPGATITWNSAGWVVQPQLAPYKLGLVNANWAASSLTDQNIDVEGCSAIAAGTFATDAGFHHISIRKASRIRVRENGFVGGGDGVALLGTDDTVVADNAMTGATNACWDHWEAPTALTVRNNVCTTSEYGVLVTGTNTATDLAGQAFGGEVAGNTVNIVGAVAGASGIWLNGLGPSGSGASGVKVHDNTVIGDGASVFTCLNLSGNSSDDAFWGNTCKNGALGSQGFGGGSTDAGGTPHDGVVIANTFDNINVSAGSIATIQLLGPNMRAYQNRVMNGSFPYCVWLGSTNNVALDNRCDAGTSGMFNLTGSTAPIASANGGGMSLIATKTANNSAASLDFTALPGGYNSLMLDCNNILPATYNVGIGLQVGEGSGPTWETANYKYSGSAYRNGTQSNPFSTSDAQIAAFTVGISNSFPYSLKAYISMIGSYKIINFTASYMSAVDGPNLTWLTGSGAYTGDSNPITAVRLLIGSGNMAQGTCSLYGLSPN